MKKSILGFAACAAALLLFGTNVKAQPGDAGFSGGITPFTRLNSKTAEVLAAEGTNTAGQNNNVYTNQVYKEILIIDGIPREFEGLITFQQQGGVTDEMSGKYQVTYDIRPYEDWNYGFSWSSLNVNVSANAAVGFASDTVLRRLVRFDVSWYRDTAKNQVHKNYDVVSWEEHIFIGGAYYSVNPARSNWQISILEIKEPGVLYFKGNQSFTANYFDADGYRHEVHRTGDFYGMESAVSQSEVHNITGELYNLADFGGWSMGYSIRPAISSIKDLNYSANLPSLISFPGNYQEVLIREAGLVYDLLNVPANLYGTPDHGTASIDSPNTFENLIFTDTSRLEASWAHTDISRLYSIGVLTQPVEAYVPGQHVTRSEFFVMLSRALKLRLEPIPAGSSRIRDVEHIVFTDITRDRPDYPYIMAAYKAGLTTGKGNSRFMPEDGLVLEEAVHIIVNSLGLRRLGLQPTMLTPFTDDGMITPWAKQAVYAAERIGIITPDTQGMINPQTPVSKAAAAAFINLLLDYMREDLKTDYSEHIVNFIW